jgi:hypothetical protein
MLACRIYPLYINTLILLTHNSTKRHGWVRVHVQMVLVKPGIRNYCSCSICEVLTRIVYHVRYSWLDFKSNQSRRKRTAQAIV